MPLGVFGHRLKENIDADFDPEFVPGFIDTLAKVRNDLDGDNIMPEVDTFLLKSRRQFRLLNSLRAEAGL